MRNILEIKQHCFAGTSTDKIKTFLQNNGYDCKEWYFDDVRTKLHVLHDLHFQTNNQTDVTNISILSKFWKEIKTGTDDIRLADIVGHNHGSITSKCNWITLLSCLQRNKFDTNSENIRQLLINQKEIPDDSDCIIHLEKYGQYYLFRTGRHRVVQAKFLEVETIHCRVTEYIFDNEAYNLFLRINEVATINDIERWIIDSPIKGNIGKVYFDIPLSEMAIKTLEQVIQKTKKISESPVQRLFYSMNCKTVNNYFDLRKTNSPKEIIQSLLKYNSPN